MGLINILHKTGMLDRVHAINLIEPSLCSLNRAEFYLQSLTQNLKINLAIHKIQKYLPSSIENEPIDFLTFSETGISIHIFSNILDIASVDIKKTAELIADWDGDNHLVCVGPINKSGYRINEFFKCIFEFKECRRYQCYMDPAFHTNSDYCNHIFGCLATYQNFCNL